MVAILCATGAVVSMACGGSSSDGELYLTVIGDGRVGTSYVGDNTACQDGGCSVANTADAGPLAIRYTAGSEVSLDAIPDTGWHFISWQITIESPGQPTSTNTSASPSIAIFDTGNRMNVVATFSP
jgi:hypothetical protein